ncbi:hypothetical protein GCM10009077_36010 [Roseibium denhamense]
MPWSVYGVAGFHWQSCCVKLTPGLYHGPVELWDRQVRNAQPDVETESSHFERIIHRFEIVPLSKRWMTHSLRDVLSARPGSR